MSDRGKERDWRGIRGLFRPPDPLLADEIHLGEIATAWVRVGFATTLFVASALNNLVAWMKTGIDVRGVGFQFLVVNGIAVCCSFPLLVLARRRFSPSALSFVSAGFDVAIVTACVVAVGVTAPDFATVALATLPLYLVVTLGTTLRLDTRLCLATGLASLIGCHAGILYVEHYGAPTLSSEICVPGTRLRVGLQLMAGISQLCATAMAVLVVLRSQRLSTLSIRDRLTGLLNRGYFDERLARELERSERAGGSLTVALLDVDHFKRFNDQHGHAAGDQVLRAVADTLRSVFRAFDPIARFGGEEFAMLLLDAPTEATLARFEALRRAIAERRVTLRGHGPVSVTVSMGIAGYPRDGSDPRGLLEVADRRLYAAKRSGRNCVVAADPPEPTALSAATGS